MGCGCESGFGARQRHWERVGGRGRVGVKAGGGGGGGGQRRKGVGTITLSFGCGRLLKNK